MIGEIEIISVGKSLPEKILTNTDLESMVDTSDEWITKRTGIKRRRVCTDENARSLATKASLQALERAGIKPSDLGFIVASTVTNTEITPSLAGGVQREIGSECPCMDVGAGCSGFIYALVTASGLMETLECEYALVIAAEVLSDYVDWSERSTCVLFGDGAGAVVLKRGRRGLHYPILEGSADIDDTIIIKRELRKTPFNNVEDIKPEYLRLKGQDVFIYATSALESIMDKMQRLCGDKPFTKVIPHQANEKIIDYVIRKTGYEKDQFFINIDEYANTSSATIPIALCDAQESGWLKHGDRLALIGFGSGLTCGGVVVDWMI
ncbi:MAG: 3-oxoacyl-ACP synthase III family protein [Christensenellales bacterium]